MKLELEYIEKLAKVLSDYGLTEISLENDEHTITVRKDLPGNGISIMPPLQPLPPAASAPAPALAKEEEVKEKGRAITSPMVGTFFAASSPEAEPFVEVGSTVNTGDVVCIIEAMKLMNEIKSEFSGKIMQICVKNGDPVEYGQTLMYVE